MDTDAHGGCAARLHVAADGHDRHRVASSHGPTIVQDRAWKRKPAAAEHGRQDATVPPVTNERPCVFCRTWPASCPRTSSSRTPSTSRSSIGHRSRRATCSISCPCGEAATSIRAARGLRPMPSWVSRPHGFAPHSASPRSERSAAAWSFGGRGRGPSCHCGPTTSCSGRGILESSGRWVRIKYGP